MDMRHLLNAAILLSFAGTAAAECVSCQIHRQGGATLGTYGAPLYPAYPYGRVWPDYGYADGSGYPEGYLRHRCGPGGDCVTTYKGPASDIRQLPRIDRQMRQVQPRRSQIRPTPPQATPYR